MAGKLTLWGAGEVLRTYFSKSSEPPASIWVALIRTISPTAYSAGMDLDEPSLESGYTRVEIPNGPASWLSNEGQQHVVANDQDVSFIAATEEWGWIYYWALCNQEQEGQVIAVGKVESDLFISVGDVVHLAAGDLTVELGPFYTDGEA